MSRLDSSEVQEWAIEAMRKGREEEVGEIGAVRECWLLVGEIVGLFGQGYAA